MSKAPLDPRTITRMACAQALQAEMRKLPTSAEPILRKMIDEAERLGAHRSNMEEALADKPSQVVKAEQVKRSLSTARKGFKALGGFDPAVDEALDDLYQIADARLGAYKARRRSVAIRMLGPLKRWGRSSPGVPMELWVFGIDALNKLIGKRIAEMSAANAIAACLKPMLPAREWPHKKGGFSGDSLRRKRRQLAAQRQQ